MLYSFIYKTSLGPICISANENAVVGVNFTDVEQYPLNETELIKNTYIQLKEYIEGKRSKFNVPIEINGTEFQKKVWRALCDIEYGKTCSYKDIAVAIGNERACRAVGMANNKNPIAIIIPCHRVIGANGSLVGYGGGLNIKEQLLNIEQGIY